MSTSLERSMEPTFSPSRAGVKEESSPSRRKELQEKLAKLNSRYVVGSSGGPSGGEKVEIGKVGLAALQDIAARQEAALALEDITPTNDQTVLSYDPVNNKMSLGSLPSTPSASKPTSPLHRNPDRYTRVLQLFNLFSADYIIH